MIDLAIRAVDPPFDKTGWTQITSSVPRQRAMRWRKEPIDGLIISLNTIQYQIITKIRASLREVD